MTRITLALVLEHGFQRVEVRVAPGNIASRRVTEKAGFTYEGLLRNAGIVHSGRVDLQVWSMVAADLQLAASQSVGRPARRRPSRRRP